MKKEIKPNLIKLNASQRLYHLEKPIIGLTGGIASGKSTVAQILKDKGYKIIDADQLVKKIYSKEETKDFIKSIASDCVDSDQINFSKLREQFFSDHLLKEKIERFIYQKLPDFFLKEVDPSDSFIIYDVPLLFEKNLNSLIDFSILVYCPKNLQLERLKNRDRISNDLAKKILDNQMDIEIKKNKSDFIIDNSEDLLKLPEEVEKVLQAIFI